MRAMNAYSKLDYPETPRLFVEFHGSEAGVEEQAATLRRDRRGLRRRRVHLGDPRRGSDRLWKARHDAYWAVADAAARRQGLSTDVCVPISRLAECIAATEADIDEHGLIAPIVGHVGDGNFHVLS